MEVFAFLRERLGTTAAPGPLGGGTDPVAPPHLDLADVARVKNTTPAAAARARAARYLRLRKARVRSITWRTCGLHDEVWQPAPGGATATLVRTRVNLQLDRRLREIERMNFQVSSAPALIGRDVRAEALTMDHGMRPSGPWLDGFRVRIFEYPRVHKHMAPVVGVANIAAHDVPSYNTASPIPWQWESAAHLRLHYNIAPSPGLRFAPAAAADWQVFASYDYNRALVPADNSLAAALDRLFRPANDWWQRSWLFCDHVVAALHLEGLQFGLRRLIAPPSDTRFDAIRTTPSIGPVVIGALLSSDVLPWTVLIAGGASDPYFEQKLIREEELQPGDHIIIWNSWLYSMVGRGEWRLENSVVMEVDHDPRTGALRREHLGLQGHGIGQKHYPDYQAEIAGQTNIGMREAQQAVGTAVAANAAITQLAWRDQADRLVRWDPYGGFPAAPGAWWIKIAVPDADSLHRWGTIVEAQTAIPGALTDADAGGGTGYHPPPDTGSVYFPLFAPHMPDPNPPHRDLGWAEYLRRKRGGATGLPTRLHPVAIDGTMMPGLYFRGRGTPFAVIRPRIVP